MPSLDLKNLASRISSLHQGKGAEHCSQALLLPGHFPQHLDQSGQTGSFVMPDLQVIFQVAFHPSASSPSLPMFFSFFTLCSMLYASSSPCLRVTVSPAPPLSRLEHGSPIPDNKPDQPEDAGNDHQHQAPDPSKLILDGLKALIDRVKSFVHFDRCAGKAGHWPKKLGPEQIDALMDLYHSIC